MEVILFVLSCVEYFVYRELCQYGMATQRYFLVKKKKKKTLGVSMKPKNHVRKFDDLFLETRGSNTVVRV